MPRFVSTQTVENLPRDLMSTLRSYDRAWNTKDIGGVGKIIAGDYVYFTSDGRLTGRKDTLTFLASPEYKLTFAERSEINLVGTTGNVAVVSSRWKGRGTYGKEEINDDQRCGLVFIKEGRQWRLLTEHCVQIVSK